MAFNSAIDEIPICGVLPTSIVDSVSSSHSLNSPSLHNNISRIKLQNDGNDPYRGFEDYPALDYPYSCFEDFSPSLIEEQEESEYEETEGEGEEQGVGEEDDEEKEVEGEGADEGEGDGEGVEKGVGDTIADKLRPCVGMEFSTPNEAYNFYNAYACHAGFSIRRATQSKSRNGVSSIRYVCSKEGYSRRQRAEQKGLVKTPEREHGIRRTDCKASLRVKLHKGIIWQVSRFTDEHNHELVRSPSKNRNLRSQKQLSKEDKRLILELNAQGMGVSQILEFFAKRQGGKRKLHFKKKDVSNEVATRNRQIIGVDVETTLAYFKMKEKEDPLFFWAIDRDESGAARHIFWVHGRDRRAYLEFGDVVTFDTTYNTNRYSMPLAPFLGANHHRHTITFGMALLRGEKEKNFTWLFRTWLKAMFGKHPTAIITDQDPAMKAAIQKVFPNTYIGVVIEIERDTHYEVRIKSNPSVINWVPRSFLVEVDLSNEIFSCNCKGFEFEGFLCQHAIKVLQHVGFEHLPKHYILKRWCKEANATAKRPYEEISTDLGELEEVQQAFMKATLQSDFEKIEALALTSPSVFKTVRSRFGDIMGEIRSMLGNNLIKDVSSEPIETAEVEETEQENGKGEDENEKGERCLDPPLSQCKGRKKKPARMKPIMKTNGRLRKCGHCEKKVTHNRRTCPERLQDLAKGKRKRAEDTISDGEEEMDNDEVMASGDESN